jgi:predicted NUDIX family NTP pyrophosphohydrolase
MNQSAGTLLYRRGTEGLTVLLVHPSGNYNRHAPWSIPKGVPEVGESLEAAARRETFEETGIVAGVLQSLGSIDYTRSRKRVHAYCGSSLEGEPCCRSWEVDNARFVPLQEARQLLHSDQRAFLERLLEILGED